MNDALARAELASRLRALTPARVALGRTGVSQETRDLLAFQQAHAMARDAVHAHLDAAGLAAELRALTGRAAVRLHSAARDRAEYLQRPDLGRQLDAGSQAVLDGLVGDGPAMDGGCALAIVVADGLSALAVERHAAALLEALLPRLADVCMGPIAIVEQGRVAVGDAIGAALGARMCVVLIGERPGLSAPDSLGAYVTWEPRPGRTDAERNCISNIRAEGLRPAEAAAQLERLVRAGMRLRLTGVELAAAMGHTLEAGA